MIQTSDTARRKQNPYNTVYYSSIMIATHVRHSARQLADSGRVRISIRNFKREMIASSANDYLRNGAKTGGWFGDQRPEFDGSKVLWSPSYDNVCNCCWHCCWWLRLWSSEFWRLDKNDWPVFTGLNKIRVLRCGFYKYIRSDLETRMFCQK